MDVRPEPHEPELIAAVAAGRGPARLLLSLWQKIRIDWSFASDHLARAFRAERGLSSRERRFVAEALYGMIRFLRRIDAALVRGGLGRHGQAPPDRERLLALLVLDHGLAPERARAVRGDVDWARVASADDALARERDPVLRIANRHSYPDWLASRLVDDWGDEAEALAAALNLRAPMTLRVNHLKTDRDALVDALAAEGIAARPGRWAASALHAETRTNLFGLRAYRSGLFEVQDEGSQLAAELLAPPPRAVVADACAGAGGKSLALAAQLENRGRVLAVDVDRRKLAELRRRARRAGAHNVQGIEADMAGEVALPAPLAAQLGRIPRVFADVPCSGIGALRRNPEARWRLTAADLERFPRLQAAIARRALELVAPGGRLIYATCTLLRAENQAVVEGLLAAVPGLEVMPVKAIWGRERAAAITDATDHYLTVTPHHHGTDGFFAAVVRRLPNASV